MATLALLDAFIDIGGNVVDGDGTNVSLEIDGEALDDTAFGDTFRSRIGGLKDSRGSIEFNQDFAAAGLDSILFPLVNTVVTITIRPTSAVVGVNNPQYSGPALITSYTPFGEGVGEKAVATLTFEGAGVLARTTA